jgi:hypothetical protein
VLPGLIELDSVGVGATDGAHRTSLGSFAPASGVTRPTGGVEAGAGWIGVDLVGWDGTWEEWEEGEAGWSGVDLVGVGATGADARGTEDENDDEDEGEAPLSGARGMTRPTGGVGVRAGWIGVDLVGVGATGADARGTEDEDENDDEDEGESPLSGARGMTRPTGAAVGMGCAGVG